MGQDVLVDKDSFKMGSKFANKIWNASRYILMNLEGRTIIENPKLLPADKWIYSRLNSAAKSIQEAFLSYRYNDAASTAYEFFWNDFCDWYVEATKLSTKSGDDAEKDRSTTILLDILLKSLKLLHPLLPFVTEEIYQKIKAATGDEQSATAHCSLLTAHCSELLIVSSYPEYDEKLNFPEEEKSFSSLQSLVGMVRTLRSECGITQEKKLRVIVRQQDAGNNAFSENEALIKLLAGIGELQIEKSSSDSAKPAGSIGLAGTGFELFVFVAEAVDTSALKKKLVCDLERDRKYIEGLRAKLANEQFVKNAPPELVAEQKAKLDDALKRTEKLENYLRDL
jgi:valyl-tRNA synthetase